MSCSCPKIRRAVAVVANPLPLASENCVLLEVGIESHFEPANTLNDTERAGVLRYLIIEGDLSGYGLVNAVTHYSQDVEDYDRATEFEALGGKLIELAPTEWKGLAHAT